MTQLRPLGLGEIIDRATSLWRSNWKPLFALFLPFQLVEYIVLKAGLLAGRTAFPLMTGDPASLELIKADPVAGLTQAAGFMGLMGAGLLFSFLATQVSSVASTHLMYPRVTGTAAPDVGQSVKFAFARLGPTMGSFFLSLGWTFVVSVAVLAGGFIAAGVAAWLGPDHGAMTVGLLVLAAAWVSIGSLVLLLWFIIRFVLVGQVIAVEAVGSMAAFRRSGTLAAGSVGPGLLGWVKARLTVLLTIVGGVLVIVSLVSTLPVVVVGVFYGANFNPGHTVDDVVPQVILVPIQVLQVVLGALVAPLFDALKVMFYVDMRVRREGLDLELKLA